MDAAETINQKPKIRLKLTPPTKPMGAALTFHSSLGAKFTNMLSLNSVAAVSQEIAANAGIIQARSPVQPVDALGSKRQAQPSPQRSLEAVPPAPATPMPRGSLLDLRV
jgi:hypothetical protein